jgi:hypothetical protein
MRPSWKLAMLASIAMASTWAPGRTGLVDAQEETRLPKSSRGGLLAKSDGHQFEVLFFPTGVRVFPQNNAGAAVDASQLTGTATFYHPNSSKPWFSRPLRGSPASLDLAVGLGNAPQAGAKVAFELTGLSGTPGSNVDFTVPLEFMPRAAGQPTIAQPAAPGGGVPSVPRYTYGPGYRGYGYYEYTSPAAEPRAAGRQAYMSSIPGMYGPGGMSVGPAHRDWSTGRDSPLAKPWMRAAD